MKLRKPYRPLTPPEEMNERLKLLAVQISGLKRHFETYFASLDMHYEGLLRLINEHPELLDERKPNSPDDDSKGEGTPRDDPPAP
jgi:hypothetical protein